jgi:hypothetical protein
MKWREFLLCVLTVVAAIILLSLFLYYVQPQYKQDSNDVVSALSILVTILITWQIWTVVGINKRIEQLENDWANKNVILNKYMQQQSVYVNKQMQNINDKSMIMDGANNVAIADVYYTLMEDSINSQNKNTYTINRLHLFLKYELFAIQNFSNVNQYDICNILIERIIEMIPNGCVTRLKDFEYKEILEAYSLIKSDNDKMPKYLLMIRRINQLDPNNDSK